MLDRVKYYFDIIRHNKASFDYFLGVGVVGLCLDDYLINTRTLMN
jgi:hypothetical protein